MLKAPSADTKAADTKSAGKKAESTAKDSKESKETKESKDTKPPQNIFPTHEKYETSIVEMAVTAQHYNYEIPWLGSTIYSTRGTGFVIDRNEKYYIISNAHVIKGQVQVKARIANSEMQFKAIPRVVCYQSDMALLEVIDPSFIKHTKPVKLGAMVKLRDRVYTIGFPTGGREISVTKGIVSRIEVRPYSISNLSMLQVQVDSAINPGNSGGPIFSKGKVVGIAFQGIFGSGGLGYMIPIPIIHHFLADAFLQIEKGIPYRGFPILPLDFQFLISPSLREYYHMIPEQHGVRITNIDYLSDAYKKLKVDDIILEIDSLPVSNEGKVDIAEIGNRINMFHVIHMKHLNDTIKLKILREESKTNTSKVMEVSVALDCVPLQAKMIPQREYDRPPTYYFSSGIQFQPLTLNFLNSPSGYHLYNYYISGKGYLSNAAKKKDMNEQFIIINAILDCDETLGFSGYVKSLVKEINGKNIKNMEDVLQAMQTNTKPYHCIILDTSTKIVVKNMSKKDHDELLRRYSIKFDRSDDLLKLTDFFVSPALLSLDTQIAEKAATLGLQMLFNQNSGLSLMELSAPKLEPTSEPKKGSEALPKLNDLNDLFKNEEVEFDIACSPTSSAKSPLKRLLSPDSSDSQSPSKRRKIEAVPGRVVPDSNPDPMDIDNESSDSEEEESKFQSKVVPVPSRF